MEGISQPTQKKVPQFGPLAGIGGVIAYMFGFAPALIGIMIVAAVDFNNKSTTDPNVLFQDVVLDISTSLWAVVAILVSQSLLFLGYSFLVSKFRGSGNYRNDFGLRFTWYSPLFILLGIAIQFFGVIIGIPFVILRDGETPQQEIVQNVADSRGLSFIILMLLVAFIVPTIEEICFRSLLQRSFSRYLSPFATVLSVAFIFALVHLSDPNVIFSLTQLLIVGIVTGALAMYSGRVDTAIFTHIGFNLTTVVILLLIR